MSDEPKDQAEKKIIIDEDWKTRVEAEKEQLRRPQEQPTGPQPGKPEPEAAFPPDQLLHELRMSFVTVQQRAGA